MDAVHYLTFTANPLAETTFDFADWSAGRTQRARSATFQMGGKGINVAKMLRRLGAQVTALTFSGGASGEDCQAWLSSAGLAHVAFATQAPTREGLVVRAPGKAETTFLGPDSPPDAAAWARAADWIERFRGQVAPAGRAALALCGSAPGWADDGAVVFREGLERWMAAGLPLFVDTYGPPLAWCVEHPVALVKINAEEFRALCRRGADAATPVLLEEALQRWPVRAWVVTDGPGEVWYATIGDSPRSAQPPSIREVSATGSGDVMMACLMEGLLGRGLTLAGAVGEAIPQAAANAAHPGIAEF